MGGRSRRKQEDLHTMTQTAQGSTALQTWAIDPIHSIAEFGIRHMMISTVKGRFGVVSGALQFDGTDPTTGSVEASIDVASITTEQEQRDNHLRSSDFFHVEQHPTLTFRSRSVEHVSDDLYRVHGDLTIRGVTRPVTLDATYEGQIADPWGNQRTGFSAETTINRKDYGLNWNQALETGGVVVGDKVKVSLHIEAVRQ
jgi:polyisoprenoid-binding protein YceI